MRTIQELAREALEMQDACNLSGVAISFAQAVRDLRAALPDAGTREINEHPIVRLWVDKLRDLAGECGIEHLREVRRLVAS